MNIRNVFIAAAAIAGSFFTVSAAEPIEEYFLDYLGGNHIPYSSSETFKVSQIYQTRTRVWEAWKNANAALKEDKLPELKALSAVTASKWEIPASLEPNASMPFYYGSKGEAPSDGYPFYIYMHGSGPKSHEWAAGLSLAQRFDDAPSVYFIPQIPNEGEYYRWWQRGKQYAWNKVLRQVLLSGDIDMNRIYMFGISEGAYGSQRLASFYADYLAGAAPMAGGEPLKNAPVENLRNTAFSLRTGDKDFGFYRDKLTRYTSQALDSMQNLFPGEFEHFIELIPGRGHSIDYAPSSPWLRTHVRNPYPKHVIWENFEMDGQYRDGFYNIYVNERSNSDGNTRTRYDMDIDGNDITLNVSEVTYTTTETDQRWGIALAFSRSYTPAVKGKVTVYLNEELVDLKRPVTLTVNGRRVFKGKLKLSIENMVNSCAAYFDPARIYPAAIVVDLAE